VDEDSFFRPYLSVSRTTRTICWATETPVVPTIAAFAFLMMINRSFSTIDRRQSSRISVFNADRESSFVSVFLNHLPTVVD